MRPRRLSLLRKPAGIGLLVIGAAGGLAWYLIDFPSTAAAGRSRLAAAILLVAGVGGGLYLLMGKRAAAIGGVLVAVIGVVLALVQFQLPNETPSAAPSPTATTPVVSMSIEKPANNGTVEMLDDVQIRIKGASDRQVWLLVRYAGGSTVFPQGPCDDKPETELNVCHKMQFGDKSTHAGTEFKVTAVIISPADPDGYKMYYANGFPQGPSPVEQLASSQTITVRRR